MPIFEGNKDIKSKYTPEYYKTFYYKDKDTNYIFSIRKYYTPFNRVMNNLDMEDMMRKVMGKDFKSKDLLKP